MVRVINQAKVNSIKRIADEVLEIRISCPVGFSYLAGQFIQLAIPGSAGEILRSYSLSSYPAESELEFCVKLLPDGVGSNFFRALQVDDTINFYGPAGRFSVPTEVNKPLVFIATGSGLAPIIGMISDSLRTRNISQPIQLLFGVRSTQDIFWAERLQKLAKEFSNFSYITTLSQEPSEWTGKVGRVTTYLEILSNDAIYFICGGSEMVSEVKQYLQTKEVPPTNIHLEIF